ncbi:MAG: transglutaminase protein [Microbacteriaceae bacterium]|nr:transglutaminase protein [Microbacteriaceae bacterium]
MTALTTRRRRKLTPGFVATNTVMLWIATAIASTALWPTYRSTQIIVVIVVATLAGSAIAITSARLRWSSLITLLVTIGVFLLLGVPLAVPDQALFGVIPTWQGIVDLVTGAALGWKQLLTITLPVGSYQALLVPAFILVLGTTTAGLLVALRARWGELGAFAPALLFVLAILFGPGVATWPLPTTLGLLAALMLWLVWWRWYRRRESIRMLAARALDAQGRPLETVSDGGFPGVRSLLSAGLILVIAAGASMAASTALPPTGERQVLRTAVVQPFDPRDYASPLSGFRHYELPQTADRTVFSVTGLPAGARIRIATLDTYDGIVYSVGSDTVSSDSGSFTRVPYTFDQSAVKGKDATIGVTVGDYDGVWVPTVGKFTSIDFSGNDSSTLRDAFYYNDTSGTAAVVTPLSSGDRYTLDAVLPTQPTEAQLASLKPGAVQVPRVTVMPDEVSTALNGWITGTASPGRQLVQMLDELKKNGYVSHGVSSTDPPSRSGHAAERITQLLTDQRMIGDQEQYAVTAALMARQIGFPARVVFGFAPKNIDTAGTTRVRGDDVSAWIEVDTSRYGWVTIDPTPPVRAIPAEQPQEPTRIALPQSPVQPPVEDPQVRTSQVPPDSTQDQPEALAPWLVILFAVLRILGWVLLGAAIVLAPFIAIVATKLRRRHQRRTADTPIERISGGWEEYEDAIVDRGYTAPAAATRTEVAAAMGGMRPLVLASIADRAMFAPGDPDADEADNVWRSVNELVATLDDDRTRWQRIRAAISLRSLGGYSVSKFFKR